MKEVIFVDRTFTFCNGATFFVTDGGDEGLIMSISGEKEDNAIVLPSLKCYEFMEWVRGTIGQQVLTLPIGFEKALQSVINSRIKDDDRKILDKGRCALGLRRQKVSSGTKTSKVEESEAKK